MYFLLFKSSSILRNNTTHPKIFKYKTHSFVIKGERMIIENLKQLVISYIILSVFFFILGFILGWGVIGTIIFLSVFFAIEFLVLKYRPKEYTKEKEKKHLLYLFGFGLLILGIPFLIASIFVFQNSSEVPPPWVVMLILISLILGPILIWYANTLSERT